jgi:hypothetical protein
MNYLDASEVDTLDRSAVIFLEETGDHAVRR